jgi:hypothetical protein
VVAGRGRSARSTATDRTRRCDALLAAACEGAERWTDGFARLLLRCSASAGCCSSIRSMPELARLWRGALERELADPSASAERDQRGRGGPDRSRLATAAGPRGEDATNLFVERPGGGARTLLRHRGGALYLAGERVERATLRAYLDEDPTSVTPAAGLRPVLQDLMLPTAAFVVGPGELRYLAQLRPVYESHRRADAAGVAARDGDGAAAAGAPHPRAPRLDWRSVQADPAARGVRAAAAPARLRRRRRRGAGHGRARVRRAARGDHGAIDPTLDGAVQRGRHHSSAPS